MADTEANENASTHATHHLNHTGNGTYLFFGYGVIVPLSILMVVFMILAVIGNIMVIMTITRHRGMRTRTNMFIVNLAVADILVAVLDMPVSLITIIQGDWVFGDPLCQFNGFTMALFLICSIHTLMYISIHKFISITRPFSRAMTPRRIKMMIAAAWIWSLICASGPLLKWNKIVYKKGASQCGPGIPMTLIDVSHSLVITTSNYIIPLVVMSFCYYRIFREIHDHMKRIRETSNIDLESTVAQQKKVSVTLFWVLACFLVCWTPFVIYSTTLAFMKDKSKMPPIINPLAYWCGYMNSACNPIIYAFRSPSFRQGYKEIMCGDASRLSGANSLSFRSRSGRGSTKSNSHFKASVGTISRKESSRPQEGDDKRRPQEGERQRRPRKMLSQTSWASLPLIPYIIRSLSRNNGSALRVNRQISENKKSGNQDQQGSIPEETSQDIDSLEADERTQGSETTLKNKRKKKNEQKRKENFNYLGDDHHEWENETGEANERCKDIELSAISEVNRKQNKIQEGENGILNDSKRSAEKSVSEGETEGFLQAEKDDDHEKPNAEHLTAEDDSNFYEISLKV